MFYKILFLLFTLFFINSCASETSRISHSIRNDEQGLYSYKDTQSCFTAMNEASNREDRIFNTRIIATPIIGFVGAIASPVLLISNLILDTRDRMVASNIKVECGGTSTKVAEIVEDVSISAVLNMGIQGADITVYPGGEEVAVDAVASEAR